MALGSFKGLSGFPGSQSSSLHVQEYRRQKPETQKFKVLPLHTGLKVSPNKLNENPVSKKEEKYSLLIRSYVY